MTVVAGRCAGCHEVAPPERRHGHFPCVCVYTRAKIRTCSAVHWVVIVKIVKIKATIDRAVFIAGPLHVGVIMDTLKTDSSAMQIFYSRISICPLRSAVVPVGLATRLILTLLRLFAQNSFSLRTCVRTHETKSIIRRVRLSSDYFTIEKWAGGADSPVVLLIIGCNGHRSLWHGNKQER